MTKTPGQFAYEEDVRREPHYHDGGTRKTWEQLTEAEKATWHRNPTARVFDRRPGAGRAGHPPSHCRAHVWRRLATRLFYGGPM